MSLVWICDRCGKKIDKDRFNPLSDPRTVRINGAGYELTVKARNTDHIHSYMNAEGEVEESYCIPCVLFMIQSYMKLNRIQFDDEK